MGGDLGGHNRVPTGPVLVSGLPSASERPGAGPEGRTPLCAPQASHGEDGAGAGRSAWGIRTVPTTRQLCHCPRDGHLSPQHRAKPPTSSHSPDPGPRKGENREGRGFTLQPRHELRYGLSLGNAEPLLWPSPLLEGAWDTALTLGTVFAQGGSPGLRLQVPRAGRSPGLESCDQVRRPH